MKRIGIVLFVAVMVLTGCAWNNANTEYVSSQEEDITNMELTERQKKICEKEGWSQDPSDWKGIQPSTVINSDKCLEYLENTYPEDEFEYQGYTGAGFMGSSISYMTASSKLAGKRHPIYVDIEYDKNGNYIFGDNYGPAVESYTYAEEVAKFVKEKYPEAEMFYDGNVDTKEYEEGNSNIITRASGLVNIVMNNEFNNEGELKELLAEIGTWLYENRPGESKRVWILVLSGEDMKEATIDNFAKEYYKQDKYVYSFDVTVEKDGELKIGEK